MKLALIALLAAMSGCAPVQAASESTPPAMIQPAPVVQAKAQPAPTDPRREQLIRLWKSAVAVGDKETMQFVLQRLFPPAPQRTKCTPDNGGGYTCITE